MNFNGRPIGRATVTVSGGNLGAPIVVLTNTFGYFKFDLEVGNSYALSVSAKRYEFADSNVFFSLGDNIAGINFFASPPAPQVRKQAELKQSLSRSLR